LRLGRVLGLDQLFHCRESLIRRIPAPDLLTLLNLRLLLLGFLGGLLSRRGSPQVAKFFCALTRLKTGDLF
jgi:hypothetical protein